MNYQTLEENDWTVVSESPFEIEYDLDEHSSANGVAAIVILEHYEMIEEYKKLQQQVKSLKSQLEAYQQKNKREYQHKYDYLPYAEEDHFN